MANLQWIVMTSGAPNRLDYGRYRNIALVKMTTQAARDGDTPKAIDERRKNVEKVIRYGAHFVGTTARCTYAQELERACLRCDELNAELNGD